MEIVYDAIIKVMLIGILAWYISYTAKEYIEFYKKNKQ